MSAPIGILLAVGAAIFLGYLLRMLIRDSNLLNDNARAKAILEEAKAQLRAAQEGAARARQARIDAEQWAAQFRANWDAARHQAYQQWHQQAARRVTQQYAETLLQRWATPGVDEAAKCAKVLIRFAEDGRTPETVLADQTIFNAVWRKAAQRTHPDRNNGQDGQDFQKVMKLRDRIKTLKGWQ